jgi:hypothetical protein
MRTFWKNPDAALTSHADWRQRIDAPPPVHRTRGW